MWFQNFSGSQPLKLMIFAAPLPILAPNLYSYLHTFRVCYIIQITMCTLIWTFTDLQESGVGVMGHSLRITVLNERPYVTSQGEIASTVCSAIPKFDNTWDPSVNTNETTLGSNLWTRNRFMIVVISSYIVCLRKHNIANSFTLTYNSVNNTSRGSL